MTPRAIAFALIFVATPTLIISGLIMVRAQRALVEVRQTTNPPLITANPPPIVVPAEIKDFCTPYPLAPAPIGRTICFHRNGAGKLEVTCASDEMLAATVRAPLCLEVFNAK